VSPGAEEFARQLKELGYPVESNGNGRVAFPYTVPAGRFSGQQVRLGLEIPADFPRMPPSGPHISPVFLPINTGVERHPDKVADSPFGETFGGKWMYWSRPNKDWTGRERVEKYLAFLHSLFATT
jgi:hypothetical protein